MRQVNRTADIICNIFRKIYNNSVTQKMTTAAAVANFKSRDVTLFIEGGGSQTGSQELHNAEPLMALQKVRNRGNNSGKSILGGSQLIYWRQF